VDGHMRTNVPGVYAVGDATGGVQLAHAASYGGITAVCDILGEERNISAVHAPMCVYTDPEIASVGMTPVMAQKAKMDCRQGVFPLAANARALIEGGGNGIIKTLLDKDNMLIGAHLVGPHVTEMISFIGGLIHFQASSEDIEEIMFAHPSVSEGFGEAIMAAAGMGLRF